jgi:hypothetical protein
MTEISAVAHAATFTLLVTALMATTYLVFHALVGLRVDVEQRR